MNHQQLVEWLFKNGGTAIRYRTATELMLSSKSINVAQLAEDLLQSQLVRTWLDRFTPGKGIKSLHGSNSTTLENVMGKLTDLGCSKGMAELDKQTNPFRKWLQDNAARPPIDVHDSASRVWIAAFLARAGYANEPAVGTVLKNRLGTIYDFTRQGNYDIYVDSADYPRMPPSFQGKPLVNPALTKLGNNYLPSIYDIVGLAAYLPECGTEDDWRKTDTIINYILNDQYQKLAPGYGILRTENGRYYAIGWSVHLPGFFGAPSDDTRPHQVTSKTKGAFVQRLILMRQFPRARSHPWFINGLNHLQSFQTENGTYLFPRSYLREDSVGYWVVGRRMGLEENRRTRLAYELESTFWMTMLQSLASARVETSSL